MIYKVTPPALSGTVKIALPASKSLSNRALAICALSGGMRQIENLAECDDTEVMKAALDGVRNAEGCIDVHGAGTAMRFLTACLAIGRESNVITGSERMCRRPIGILVEALRSLGAAVDYCRAEGFPPLRVGGARMHGGALSLPADISSQYVSALLMIAPCLDGGLTLKLEGVIASRPYIDMTLQLMCGFGADARWIADDTLRVEQSEYTARPYAVESDWSAASYWYEIALLSRDDECCISLPHLSAKSLQGDARCSRYFSALGVDTAFSEGVATLRKRKVEMPQELVLDLGGEPDLAQTLVAACCGKGIRFSFSGLANLRVKETDRIAALENELRKLGYVVKHLAGGTVYWDGETCPVPEGAVIATYDDHRMAMCMAPLCISKGSVSIADPAVVAKSYPHYWDDLRLAGFTIEEIK